MAQWRVRWIDRNGEIPMTEYTLANPEVEIRNSEPGGFSGEIALGQLNVNNLPLTRDEFIPYETYYQVRRVTASSSEIVSGGMLTSMNLNFNRDTVLIAGKDWLHYPQRRLYPFNPESYVTFATGTKHSYWDKWPKKWGVTKGGTPIKTPVDCSNVIRDLLLSMKKGIPIDQFSSGADRIAPDDPYTPPIVWNIPNTGTLVTHQINPGDQRTIFDHITLFSEMRDGFEFDIDPVSLEFKLWSPSKWSDDVPVYVFQPTANAESAGQIVDFDWTNEGPEGTYLYGLGAGESKMGRVWTTDVNQAAAGRLDLLYDYGEVRDRDVILQRLKDQNDLWNQKKLSLSILNPDFLIPSFYAQGRPRELIGATVQVLHDFNPLHRVDAYFTINAIKINADNSGNEIANLELMMNYEPETGQSGGRSEELP